MFKKMTDEETETQKNKKEIKKLFKDFKRKNIGKIKSVFYDFKQQ